MDDGPGIQVQIQTCCLWTPGSYLGSLPFQLLPKCLEGFHHHLPGRPRWQQSGDLEIKDYKNIVKAGEESEQPKQDRCEAGVQEMGIAEVGSVLSHCPIKVLLR